MISLTLRRGAARPSALWMLEKMGLPYAMKCCRSPRVFAKEYSRFNRRTIPHDRADQRPMSYGICQLFGTSTVRPRCRRSRPGRPMGVFELDVFFRTPLTCPHSPWCGVHSSAEERRNRRSPPTTPNGFGAVRAVEDAPRVPEDAVAGVHRGRHRDR